ncbi:MAG TPA: hypothetical protein VFU19_16390 [Iamia sp.]|nr:hypothetical protein [Iamia sp.]
MSPLDLVRRRATATDTAPAPAPAPGAPRPSVAERVVARTAGILSGGHSRRRFLARTAVVGSALAVNPVSYLLKPGTAYGAVCGTCGDGWTAFCCTINNGSNSCPPATFVAGWWKADGSAYCGGGPRYIIDCNATCPTQCSCRCSGAACDGRRTCCNQFRYGQCNQQISCYGPVACRVAICITPWTYDPACSTRTLTDNRTADHGAACLTNQASSPIARKYQALGGAGGFLGKQIGSERDTPNRSGRLAVYEGGRIYDSPSTNPQEVHGSILDLWLAAGGHGSAYGYPTTDVSSSGSVRYSRFQRGGIYRFTDGSTYGVPEPYYAVWQQYGGLGGVLGRPTGSPRRSADERAIYINFATGRIYRRSQVTVEIHGAIFTKHEALGGIAGALGHVATNVTTLSDGRGRASIFEHGGVIYYSAATGAFGVWGSLLTAYLDDGGPTGRMGYPTSDRGAVGDGRGVRFTTQHGAVYATSETGAHVVPPGIFARYRDAGGPGGSYGYPTGDPERLPGAGVRQAFEGGTITVTSPFVPFVKATYQDFLDRAPSAQEIDLTATSLANGASKAAYVRGLARSDEYLSALVNGFYDDTLGRPGSQADVAFWVGELRRGVSVPKVAAFFYASKEYYEGFGGGTVRGWITDLYGKLLGRTPSEDDLVFWEGQVASRGRTRVALDLYQSAESRGARVQKLYQALLGRGASSADATYWGGRIRTEGDVTLASTLASMQEYFDRAQTRFPS